jgi:CTP:molybdopterin cytidylyltransferase MocA
VSVAAVVLAAGASRRLGELKQLVRLQDETLVERAVRVCREAGCEPVVVVLGASADRVRETCSLKTALSVINEDWSDGMGSSVRTGIGSLGPNVNGCVIMTCDMPAVSPEHLRKLMSAEEVTASFYGERRGVPAYFPRARFTELMELRGDAGAREMLRDAPAVQLAGGEMDVDTAEDLAKARERFG